jgi:hypothetical protein
MSEHDDWDLICQPEGSQCMRQEGIRRNNNRVDFEDIQSCMYVDFSTSSIRQSPANQRTPLLHQGHCDDALELRDPYVGLEGRQISQGRLLYSDGDIAGANRKSRSRHDG